MSTVGHIERIVKRSGRVLNIHVGDSVAAGARKMSEHQVGCLVVLDQHNNLIGILSERDIISKVVSKAKNPAATPVEEVMTSNVISCGLDMEVAKAQRIMAERGIRHLPIVEDGVPVGMISSRDVMAHELSTTRAVVRRQSRLLKDLESEHPGITHIQTDLAGRIIF